jgi:hypothetical protein
MKLRLLASDLFFRHVACPPMNFYDAQESTLPILPSVLERIEESSGLLRRWALRDAASICFLVCLCIVRV